QPSQTPWQRTAWNSDGWRFGGRAGRQIRFAHATVFLDAEAGARVVPVEGAASQHDDEPLGSFGLIAGSAAGAYVDDDAVWVRQHGRTYVIERKKPQEAALAEGEAAINAPMPGSVVAVAVRDGDRVEVGQHVLSVEAMKMEHRLTATQAGTVRLEVAENEQVTRGQLLAHIEAEDAA
ncbi:MAG TPA: biotin/lipoyl-binding protein, partial [Candidatus Agrococcus pullicola]|nr:biotin/lipoyl-binding protein [Candidatus Agrococcus pullicola]